MKLESKVAIVTGAARGIGRAIAARFAREGAKVLLVDIDEVGGSEAAAAINDAVGDGDGSVRFQYGDVGERLDVRNVVCAVCDTFGQVDVLVNNAGIARSGDLLDIEEETFDQVLRTNLKGPFLLSQAVAREMVSQVEGGAAPGAIINMSSVNAVVAIPDQLAYDVSKGGLNQLTKVMALSLAPHGIRVNGIGPGSIMTDMLNSVHDDASARDKILARTPLGRIGDPEEVAAIAVFLASDDASYVTGQTLYADGGRLGLNYTVPVKS